jgi:ribonuclease Z
LKVTILGSNSASPAHDRHPSSQILDVENDYYMIDCGEGTQFQLNKYQVSRSRIRAIFISHLHGDHYLGLLGLLTTMSMSNREEPLTVVGPNGLKEIIELQCMYSKTILRFDITYIVFEANVSSLIYEDNKVKVTTIPLMHKVDTSGYLFQEQPKKRNIIKDKIVEFQIPIEKISGIKNGDDLMLDNGQVIANHELTTAPQKPKSFAYCSDTMYHEPIIPIVEGVDMLYHEATFLEKEIERAEFTKHSTTKDAATIAQKAKVHKLMIGHYSSRYPDLSLLLSETKHYFDNTLLAVEGETYEVR